MEILNKKQEIFLEALKEFNAENGRMPSIRELKELDILSILFFQ